MVGREKGSTLLYLAHFSFDGPEPEFKAEGRGRGWFTCVVEADSVDGAVEKLGALLDSLKSWFTSFESVEVSYLDDVTEVERVPGGVLARFVHEHDDPPSWISTSLPGVPEEFCRSYEWGADEEGGEDEAGATMRPFVSFRE